MFSPTRIIYLIVFLSLTNLFFCQNFIIEDTSVDEVSKIAPSTHGLLTESCIDSYHRVFVQRAVPPRTYNYFHEDAPIDEVAISFRIVGGNEINIENAPYAVLYGGYCGGSLIAPDWVLTAAHCQDRYKYIFAGATKSNESTRFPICAHFIHPKWSDTDKMNFHDWDFQLLLLEFPVPVTARSMPIAIGGVQDIQPGTFVTVSGWGHTDPTHGTMSSTLHQVLVPVISQDVCMAIPNKYYQSVTPRMFCAGYSRGQMDACQGDSGGPVVFNNRLVGLVSYGIGCAEAGHPGVYTRVPMGRPWIRQITGLPL